MVTEEREPVDHAVFTKADRQTVEPDRDLVGVWLDDVLELVVD